MKNFTPKQIEKMESELHILSNRLRAFCQKYQIGDRVDQLVDEDWSDYDERNQEGFVNAINQVDFFLDDAAYMLTQIREEQEND